MTFDKTKLSPSQGEVTKKAARRLKILFLLPFPADLEGRHGGSRAAASIVKLLARHQQVAVLYLHPEDAGAVRKPPPGCWLMTAVFTAGRRSAARPSWRRLITLARTLVNGIPDWAREAWSPEMAAATARLAADFRPDIVHFEFNVMAQYIPVVREASPGAACIVTEHEPGTLSADAQDQNLSVRRRAGNWIRRRAWSRYERRTLAKADAIVTFTEKDRRVVDALVDALPVVCIPLRLIPERIAEAADQAIASDLLFVGAFRHPPNADAAWRLQSSIFPQIRRLHPDARMFIVGADPPAALVRAAPAGLTYTGFVEEIGPYMTGAAIVLCPLRMGGGMRVKILEACAYGKALIASPEAVEGLGMQPDKEFILARSDEEFSRFAVDLLSDSTRRFELGRAAREWALRWHDPEKWAGEYAALYERIATDKALQRESNSS